MIVTGLKRLGKGRYEVSLDGEVAFVLYKGDLARYDLHEGEELSEESRKQIYEETLRKRAVNRILFLLQSRDYTYHELEEKLRQGQYPDEITEDATFDSLESDSLDMVELICELEDRLDIDFGEPEGLETLGDIIEYIDSL